MHKNQDLILLVVISFLIVTAVGLFIRINHIGSRLIDIRRVLNQRENADFLDIKEWERFAREIDSRIMSVSEEMESAMMRMEHRPEDAQAGANEALEVFRQEIDVDISNMRNDIKDIQRFQRDIESEINLLKRRL